MLLKISIYFLGGCPWYCDPLPIYDSYEVLGATEVAEGVGLFPLWAGLASGNQSVLNLQVLVSGKWLIPDPCDLDEEDKQQLSRVVFILFSF